MESFSKDSENCEGHEMIKSLDMENKGNAHVDSVGDTICDSKVEREETVEMKMYQYLKEKQYKAFVDLVKNEDVDINHNFNESFVDVSNQGWTALHFVCQKGNEKYLGTFLDLGADLSLTDRKGNTPLHVVCKNGYHRLTKFILDRDSRIKDQQNLQGLTPLLKAIFRSDRAFKENDYEKTISCLIEAGCDVNLKPKSNVSPLHVVTAKWKSVDMVKLLLHAGADVDADTGTSTPLMTALCCQRVDSATVIALINAGANVNYQNPSLKSVLHIAVSKSEDVCVEHLLAAGADPNVTDIDGNPPLWIAVSENDIKIAPLLIFYGANVNFRNVKYGMSLLCKAVLNRNNKMVQLLLKHKADVNYSTALGATAIHYAVNGPHLDILKMLLRENPDLDNYSMFRNLYNPQNALQIAMSVGDEDSVKLLMEAGFPVQYYQMKLKNLPEAVLSNEELLQWIQDYLHNPQSLQHLSRVELRRHYRTDIGRLVQSLIAENTIPKRVGDEILLKDLLS